jgi:alanine dehydrogenase
MHAGQTLISALQIGHLKVESLQAMFKKKITALAYEFIEDKVGGMPIVRAMSEIAGSTVMLIASEYLSTAKQRQGRDPRWNHRRATHESCGYRAQVPWPNMPFAQHLD